MSTIYSFDVVSRVDMGEVMNAVEQTRKEVQTRFDLRSSRAAVELDPKAYTITISGEDVSKCRSVLEILQQRLAKRGVPLQALDVGEPKPAGGDILRQLIQIRHGISADKARELQRVIRESKIKVTVQVQEDQIRVSGPKKDDLQAVIALLRSHDFGIALQFVNYR